MVELNVLAHLYEIATQEECAARRATGPALLIAHNLLYTRYCSSRKFTYILDDHRHDIILPPKGEIEVEKNNCIIAQIYRRRNQCYIDLEDGYMIASDQGSRKIQLFTKQELQIQSDHFEQMTFVWDVAYD